LPYCWGDLSPIVDRISFHMLRPMHIVWLDRSSVLGREEVGDVAAALSRLAHEGERIAPAMVIAVDGWTDCLAAVSEQEPLLLGLLDGSLHFDSRQYQVVRHIAQKVRQQIQGWEVTPQWLMTLGEGLAGLGCGVVRVMPSLVYGEHCGVAVEQMLRSPWCLNHPRLVQQTMQGLWSEVFAARNLLYWHRQGIAIAQLRLGVIIQAAPPTAMTGTLTLTDQQWQLEVIHGVPDVTLGYGVGAEVYGGSGEDGTVLTWSPSQQKRAWLIASVPTVQLCVQDVLCPAMAEGQHLLSPQHHDTLVAIAHRLRQQGHNHCRLTWTMPDGFITITGQTPYPPIGRPDSRPIHSTGADPKALVTGICASYGSIYAPVFCIDHEDLLPQTFPDGAIWVAATMAMAWLPHLHRAGGLVLEQPQMTSHGALVARELGIPALVGVPQALQRLATVSQAWLDSDRHGIFLNALAPLTPDAPAIAPAPGSTQTQVWLNLNQPHLLHRWADLPIDGVGLIRSELMMLSLFHSHHGGPAALDPDSIQRWLDRPEQLIRQWVAWLRPVVAAMAPRPVFYRSTDWRSLEFPPLPHLPTVGVNPLLGLRGTAVYAHNSQLFDIELQAIHTLQQDYGNVRMILPFVRSVAEFQAARDRLLKVGLCDHPQFELWLMAEVPSILFQLADYQAAGAQGVAIGPRDLGQLLLGYEADATALSLPPLTDHPAVWSAIESLILTAHRLRLPVSLCSSTLNLQPHPLKRLGAAGLTAISVERDAIAPIRRHLLHLEQTLHHPPFPSP
jgi:pyruvate,water dikinase